MCWAPLPRVRALANVFLARLVREARYLMSTSFEAYCAQWAQRLGPLTEGCVVPGQVEFFQGLLGENPQIRKIIEIGQNGGHSTAVFLSARPDTIVMSFDIASWDYVIPSAHMLQELWPGRHCLTVGDSIVTVPAARPAVPDFDMAFVDGYHFGDHPRLDMINALDWLRPGGVVVLDDTNYQDVAAAWDCCVAEGRVQLVASGTAEDRCWKIGTKVGDAPPLPTQEAEAPRQTLPADWVAQLSIQARFALHSRYESEVIAW